MLFGEAAISTEDFARRFVDGVTRVVRDSTKPPCLKGEKPDWTNAVYRTLEEIGKDLGYTCYYWLVDRIWWDTKDQRLVLAAECEWHQPEGEEDDFQKLPVFKCPRKLFVFSGDPEVAKRMAEDYLAQLSQHAEDEEYLLVGFTRSGPRCLVFKVPKDGRLDPASVRFSDVQL